MLLNSEHVLMCSLALLLTLSSERNSIQLLVFSLVELLGLYFSFLQNIHLFGSITELDGDVSRELLLWDELCWFWWGIGSESFNRSFLCVNVARHERWYDTENSGMPFSPTITSKIVLWFLTCAAWSNVSQELTSLHTLKLGSATLHMIQRWVGFSAITAITYQVFNFQTSLIFGKLYILNTHTTFNRVLSTS